MRRRWSLYTGLLVCWFLFLSICAGYGAFSFVLAAGLGDTLSVLVGVASFVTCVTLFDTQIGQRAR